MAALPSYIIKVDNNPYSEYGSSIVIMHPKAFKAVTGTIPLNVIYNGTTTICTWYDGTKTIARPQAGEKFDKETGLAMCIAKKLYGSRSKFLKAVEDGYDQNSRLQSQE